MPCGYFYLPFLLLPVHGEVENGLQVAGVAVLPVLCDGRAALEPLLPQALPGREGDLEHAVQPVLQVKVFLLGQAELLHDTQGGEHQVASPREFTQSQPLEIAPEDTMQVGHLLVLVPSAEIVHILEPVLLAPEGGWGQSMKRREETNKIEEKINPIKSRYSQRWR